MQVRLYSGQITGATPLEIGTTTPASIDRACRLVYDGIFQSMDGEVRITRDLMQKIADSHNARVGAAGGALPIGECPPVQLDHTKSARDTVGRLVGPLVVEDQLIDGELLTALLGTVRFLGAENVERSSDGRYSNVSIGADLETGILSELSVTPFPAAPRASLLSQGPKTMPDEMKKRCKKFLTSEKKMSEEDADKHLAALSEDDAKKLAEETDEHEKKLAAEEDEKAKKLAEEDDAKKKELAEGDEGKKLAAAKPKIKQLMADATAAIKLASGEARKGAIAVRLSKLRAAAKITPAEEKKLLVELTAGKRKVRLSDASDDTLELVWAVLEAREPVVHIGQIGSVKVVDLSAAGGALKQARLGANDAEVLANMPFTRAMIQATAGVKPGETKLAQPARPADIVEDEPLPNVEAQQQRVDALQEQITKLSSVMTALASAFE